MNAGIGTTATAPAAQPPLTTYHCKGELQGLNQSQDELFVVMSHPSLAGWLTGTQMICISRCRVSDGVCMYNSADFNRSKIAANH